MDTINNIQKNDIKYWCKRELIMVKVEIRKVATSQQSGIIFENENESTLET